MMKVQKFITVIKKYKNKGLEIVLGSKNAPSVSPAPGAPWQAILGPECGLATPGHFIQNVAWQLPDMFPIVLIEVQNLYSWATLSALCRNKRRGGK